MELELSQSLLWGFALLCVLPLVAFVIFAVIVIRGSQQQIDRWASADVAQIEQRISQMRERNPQASTERLVSKIIHEQAMKSGIVGVLTGLGGFWTLIIGLPVDLALTFRIQASLVNFIAYLYGDKNPDGTEARVRQYLILTGSSRITQTTTDILTRLAMRVAGKSFSKVIPIAGAIISFGVNYLIVQLMGRAAARWYARQQQATST